MAIALKHYEDALYGCRFCPMCKPAGEIPNLTMIEGHTTRARAMMLWRVLQGMTHWQARGVEQLFQTTLDSISESWCVSHYPVSGYVLAARHEVYANGLAPDAVRRVVEAQAPPQPAVTGDVLLLASELAQLGERGNAFLDMLERAGVYAESVFLPAGGVAYALGARDIAYEQAKRLKDVIAKARIVITDGPQTGWALARVWADLGIALPAGVEVVSLAAFLAQQLPHDSAYAGVKVLVHDSRAASALADTLAQPPALQPGFAGDEALLGTGEVYDAPRRIVDALGMERVFLVWSRSLSRSDGSDDGLWQTYPALAEGLARQRLAQARAAGASLIVTDSPLSAAHLARFSGETGVAVRWLPALFSEDAP